MKKIIYSNVNLYDGTKDMILQKGVDIEVIDGKITNIGKNLNKEGAKVIDFSGKFVTPGLINLHVHLPSSGKISKKKLGDKSKLVNLIKSNKLFGQIGVMLCKTSLKQAINSGVTTIRSVGGVGTFDTILRDKINKGKLFGPRLLCCNEAIGVKGGHMDGTVAHAVSSVEEAKEFVNQLKKENVDLIKLMITGGVLDGNEPGHPGTLKMPKNLVKACCDEAHKLGLKVAAHVEGEDGLNVAVDCGVDSIEHGFYIDEQLAKKMKEHKTCLVLTLSPALPFVEIPPEVTGYGEIAKINSEILVKGMISAAKTALDNNIPLGLGTDAGSTLSTHYNFYKELLFFKKHIKDDNRLVLYLATLGNATIANINDITGSVETGKSADFLVLNDDPNKNLSVFKNPFRVIMKGKMITPKIKRYSCVDELVDKMID